MPLDRRILYILGILAMGGAGFFAFTVYLEAAGSLPTVYLNQPLANVPRGLGDWVGKDLQADEDALYGDDHLYRAYTNTRTDQQITVWMIYSTVGKDRGHHPDVCMTVAGKQEDESLRQTFPVDGHPEPVQQYRFIDAEGSQWVFYWHYTMLPPENATISTMQRRYQRRHKRPSSLTIEVFAPERLEVEGDVEGAREFVKLLDAEIQSFVGSNAVRGSKRIPVWVVDQDLRRD